jgi:hypothetical protein
MRVEIIKGYRGRYGVTWEKDGSGHQNCGFGVSSFLLIAMWKAWRSAKRGFKP